jgi:integrase
MTMKVLLTDRFCASAKPGAEYFDVSVRGLALRVVAKRKTWDLHFTHDHRRVRMPLGTYPAISLAAARGRALEAKADLAEGRDPRQRQPETLRAISEEYLRREGSRLRSRDWQARALARLVYPTLGERPIAEIRRTEIIRLLDKIEDENGPAMSNSVLAAVRRIMNWHASRSDEFRSPIVPGMARTKGRARDRILNDDELRTIWEAAEAKGEFGHFLRFLLLTSARRTEAGQMRWSEINGADWTLPAERNKTKVDLVRPLSKSALACLRRGNDEFVFGPVGSLSTYKRAFDKDVPLPRWTLHDLRRTARSLMSRAGVPSDHAERCLGHVIPGVRGVYDRHEYYKEKAQAFEALAAQIERIVNPQENVVAMGRKR